jgi:hypothetical protein
LTTSTGLIPLLGFNSSALEIEIEINKKIKTLNIIAALNDLLL